MTRCWACCGPAWACSGWPGWSDPSGPCCSVPPLSIFSLREFVTLSPTRRSDHRGLVLAFFVVLPCST